MFSCCVGCACCCRFCGWKQRPPPPQDQSYRIVPTKCATTRPITSRSIRGIWNFFLNIREQAHSQTHSRHSSPRVRKANASKKKPAFCCFSETARPRNEEPRSFGFFRFGSSIFATKAGGTITTGKERENHGAALTTIATLTLIV